NVTGPSAGLAFAVYLADAFDERDLVRGRHVVATGVLAQDGDIEAVGNIRQKAIAAQLAHRDLLLVPEDTVVEARNAVADACDSESQCVQVVPVSSVQDAIELLLLDDDALISYIDEFQPSL